jgi:hypothetical protein
MSEVDPVLPQALSVIRGQDHEGRLGLELGRSQEASQSCVEVRDLAGVASAILARMAQPRERLIGGDAPSPIVDAEHGERVLRGVVAVRKVGHERRRRRVGAVGILVVDPQEPGSLTPVRQPVDGPVRGLLGRALEEVPVDLRVRQLVIVDVEARVEADAAPEDGVAHEGGGIVALALQDPGEGLLLAEHRVAVVEAHRVLAGIARGHQRGVGRVRRKSTLRAARPSTFGLTS